MLACEVEHEKNTQESDPQECGMGLAGLGKIVGCLIIRFCSERRAYISYTAWF